MSRYRGPKLRITRRLGVLPGLTTKKSHKTNLVKMEIWWRQQKNQPMVFV
jgi:hypothetical protein